MHSSNDSLRGTTPYAPQRKRSAPVQHQIPERAADIAAATSGATALFGLTIGELNQYLQAGAFIVAIISGLCAAFYYIRKSRK